MDTDALAAVEIIQLRRNVWIEICPAISEQAKNVGGIHPSFASCSEHLLKTNPNIFLNGHISVFDAVVSPALLRCEFRTCNSATDTNSNLNIGQKEIDHKLFVCTDHMYDVSPGGDWYSAEAGGPPREDLS